MKKESFQAQQRRPQGVKSMDVLSTLPPAAARALEREGLSEPEQLAALTEQQLLELPGMSPAALPKLRIWLKGYGLSFKAQA